MRGKLVSSELTSGEIRITPADAGKTVREFQSLLSVQDHPRGCGENSFLLRVTAMSPGSPPRMRGKPVGGLNLKTCSGITPADAGKTRG